MRTARALAAAALATVLALQLVPPARGQVPPAPPGDCPLKVVPLGVPLSDVLLIGGVVAPGPNGKDVIWNVASGEPAYLNAIDPATGDSLVTATLPGALGSYAVAAAPDGSIYAASYYNGTLYRWRPGMGDTAESLGTPLPGQSWILRIATDPEGNVYGGTYNGGRAFKYDPVTRQTRDYGQAVAGQPYIKSIDYADGKIYAGTLPDAHLVEIDATTGAKTTIPVPPGLGDITNKPVNDLNVRNGRLYIRFATPATTLYVYDLATRTWVDEIPAAHGLDVSPPGPNGELYFIQSSELKKYDPATKTLTGTGLTFTGRIQNARSLGWAELGLPDYPGKSIVGTLWRGDMFRYNPQTGKSETLPTKVRREPIDILALEQGRSTTYTGGFLSGGVATVNTATGAAVFNRFSQTESILETRAGKVWIGAYPEARVYSYDPSKPWSSPEYSPGPPGTPDNPKLELNLKPALQMRARALAEVAGKIAIGTVPDGDRLGGALVIYDPSTKQSQVMRHIVQDESVFALTARGTVVYGGASITGGLATTPPTRKNGAVFAYDVASGKKLWETEIVGASNVNSVTLGPDGLLWGVAVKSVVAIQPSSGKLVKRYDLGTSTAGGDVVATGRYVYAGLDGAKVYRIDPFRAVAPKVVLEQRHRRLSLEGRQLAISDGPRLYRVDLPQ